MSIQVPSPSYGLVAVDVAGPSEPRFPFEGSSHRFVDRSGDPCRPPADPTTSGEPMHAASAARHSNAHAHANLDPMHHPLQRRFRRTENVRNAPRFGPIGTGSQGPGSV